MRQGITDLQTASERNAVVVDRGSIEFKGALNG
jgi:hypothetical protein